MDISPFLKNVWDVLKQMATWWPVWLFLGTAALAAFIRKFKRLR